MAETALDLKRGDSRLTEELTEPTVLRAGLATWHWMYGQDDNPTSVWRTMTQPNGAGAMKHYDEMGEKDGHYSAQLETRVEGVLSCERRIVPASESAEDQRIAGFIEDVIDNFTDFEGALGELMEAASHGCSIAENMFALDGREIRMTELRFRPQEWFAFGDAGDLRQTGPVRIQNEEPLPPNKMTVYTFRRRKGNRWGRPLARRCWWPVWFKRQDVKFWLKFIEKGTGTVIAKYPAGSQKKEQDLAKEAVMAINEETGVAIAENFAVEILEHVRQGSSDVYLDLAREFCNREISLVILGQVLTSGGSDQGSGSRALGEVHDDIREEKKQTDAKGLMGAVNRQIIRPVVTLNYGPEKATPKWVIDYEEGEDLNERVARDKIVFEMGLPIPQKYLHETYQIPEPQGDEAVVEKQAAAALGGFPGEGGEREDDDAAFAEPPHREPEQVARLGVRQAESIYAAIVERAMRAAEEQFPEDGE